MSTTRTKGDRLDFTDVVLLRGDEDGEYLVWDDTDDLLIYWNLTNWTPRDEI